MYTQMHTRSNKRAERERVGKKGREKLKYTHTSTHTRSYKARIAIDWAPDMELEEVTERLARAKAAYPKKAVSTFCPIAIPGTYTTHTHTHTRHMPHAWLPRVPSILFP